jgi:hypothetical protein
VRELVFTSLRVSLVNAVILVYDHLLTLKTEIKYIWLSKLRPSTCWFLAVRYLALASNIMVSVYNFGDLNHEVCPNCCSCRFIQIPYFVCCALTEVELFYSGSLILNGCYKVASSCNGHGCSSLLARRPSSRVSTRPFHLTVVHKIMDITAATLCIRVFAMYGLNKLVLTCVMGVTCVVAGVGLVSCNLGFAIKFSTVRPVGNSRVRETPRPPCGVRIEWMPCNV